MAWTGLGAGTELDPWQIDTKARLDEAIANNATGVFMKLMNDIDHTGLTSYAATLTGYIRGTLDGGGFGLINLGAGRSYNDGYTLFDGCAVKNITFHYNRILNVGNYAQCFYDAGNTLNSVTLQNIHAIAEGTAVGYAFAGSIDLKAACTVSDITIEGNFLCGFKGTQRCSLTNIKFYRTLPAVTNENTCPQLFNEPTGLVYRCQIIVPSFVRGGNTNVNGGLIARTISSTTIIRQCLIVANINVTQLDPLADYNPCHVLYNSHNGGIGAIVEDNLILGNFYINGGGGSSVGSTPGPNGYILGASYTTIHRRNVFNGDLSNSYFDNRPPMSKAGITLYEQANLFFNADAIVSMTATPEAGKQTGLTAAAMAVQASFTGFDFATVWQMGATTPELINNQMTGYTLPLKNVGVQSVSRVNSAGFNLVLSTFAVTSFGVDILEGATIILNSENTLAPSFTGLTSDKSLAIKPYYYDGAVKTYTGSTTAYQHYFVDVAAEAATVINETTRATLNNPGNATFVHGTIFYNGYWYGTTRNLTSFSVNDGFLCRAPENNIAAFQQIPIWVSDPQQGTGDARYSHSLEQIVLCKGKLYATFYNESLGGDYSGNWVLQYDPPANDYKVYQLGGINAIAPIITDGEHLYFSEFSRKVYKINPDIAFISGQKYNPNYNVPQGAAITLASLAVSFYDEDSQGGYITGGYSSGNKGVIHSAIADGEYLYLAYTTPASGFASGYDPATGLTYNELHKVRIADMSAAGWCYIPQCTDDMAQNATHLFLGVEVQPAANPATMGYGWGAIAVRKNDVHLTALPRLHANDNPPTNQSYGSLVFGNYLIELRTNRYLVVLDISDPDSWVITEDIGKRTVKVFINKFAGAQNGNPLNEIVADPSGRMYATYWENPAELAQFTIPGINFLCAPTLDAVGATVTEAATTLSAHILLDGGQAVTEKGFRYGRASGVYDATITSAEAGATFHAVLAGLEGGIVYYQAFATNPQGTTYSAEQTFTAPDLCNIFFDGQRLKGISIGATPLIYK